MRESLLLALAVTGGAVPIGSLDAQVFASERATLSQTIAGTVITVDYARPSLRGRDSIFGGEVKWGEVWTPGANQSTTFATSQPIRLNGQDVPAGKYSMWLTAAPDTTWTLYFHPDTTLFHVPHPSLDGMIFAFPVEPQVTDDVRETLAWDFERIRAGGAKLQLRWDRTLVSFDLEVTSGLETTVEAEIGRAFAGTWAVTWVQPDTAPAPEAPAAPDTMTLRYDDESRQIHGLMVFGDEPWEFVLVPRAEGIFLLGFLMDGELAEADTAYFLEFEYEDGRPVRFVGRDAADDEVFARAVRTGS